LRNHLGLTGWKGYSFGPTWWLRGQNIEASGPGSFDPEPYGLPRNTEDPGRFHLRHPIPNSLDRSPTEPLLGDRRLYSD